MGVLPDPAPYTDDVDAVSLHTTPGDNNYEAEPSSAAPPTYADSTAGASAGSVTGAPARPPEWGLPTGISPRTAMIAESKIIGRNTQCINEVNTLQEPQTDTDPGYLERVIRSMAKHSPTPIIQIIGTHTARKSSNDGKSSSSDRVTDFKMFINLRNYLWPEFDRRAQGSMELRTVENGEKHHRGTIFKTRAPGYKAELEIGDARPDLKEWCHRYCASSASSRIFRLERKITNLDTLHLKNRIEGLIRSTNYRGHLEISFPVRDRYVDIYTSTRIQSWRLTTWICWLFYLSFLWLFAWPYLFFTTKRYSIVRAEWPFAIVDAHGNKTYTTVSEEEWISKFGPAVRQLALDRYHGEAGDDKLAEVLARPETMSNMGPEINVGRAIGSAVNAWRGGLSIGNLARLGSTGDVVGWGFDE